MAHLDSRVDKKSAVKIKDSPTIKGVNLKQKGRKMTKLLRIAFAITAFGALPLLAQNADGQTKDAQTKNEPTKDEQTQGNQTQDEQIQSLEKELRVLELQHKIEQYKSGAIPSDTAQSEMPQSPYSKEPSGFMLGAGLALGYTFNEATYNESYLNYNYSYTVDNSRLEYGGELLLGV